MNSALCDRLGIEFPLFAFSYRRYVVAAVTNAGGFGVLGATIHTPKTLEIELAWIDEHVNGKPYGVDLLIPNNMDSKDGAISAAEIEARVPPEHRQYVTDLLAKNGLDVDDLWDRKIGDDYGDHLRVAGAAKILDVAFAHLIGLIVNALGVPPAAMMDRARAKGIAVGALTGAKEHALKHAEAGVDILIVSGTEAGGHCGEVSTLVLVPEVLDAVASYKDIDVLAAGGIATGRQMAPAWRWGRPARGPARSG